MPTLSTIINIEYYAIFYFTCILLSERALAGPKQYLYFYLYFIFFPLKIFYYTKFKRIYTFSCFIL